MLYLKDKDLNAKSLKDHLLGQKVGHPRGRNTEPDKTLEAILQTLVVVVADRRPLATNHRRNFVIVLHSTHPVRPKEHWRSLYHNLSIQIPIN